MIYILVRFVQLMFVNMYYVAVLMKPNAIRNCRHRVVVMFVRLPVYMGRPGIIKINVNVISTFTMMMSEFSGEVQKRVLHFTQK